LVEYDRVDEEQAKSQLAVGRTDHSAHIVCRYARLISLKTLTTD
uniref:DUF1330 domain-containing protein n=1 Tax=Haemonchus placei TaxID=6290 RepID=A0A0N4WVY9_HAEPC